MWENSNKFIGDETDFRKWICAITKFKAIDYYRKAARNMDVAVERVDDGFVNSSRKISRGNKSLAGDTGDGFVNSAEDEVIIKEDKNELIKFINQLEPMDRDIFIMKFFFGGILILKI